MEWREQAIFLGARKHGETSVVAEVLTAGHGRHSGLVRAGRSRRLRPVLQAGNVVDVTWRARLSEHLGSFTIEPVKQHAAMIMQNALVLSGVINLTSLCALLPEREPQAQLYEAAMVILDHLEDDDLWPAMLVRWEAGLLDALGFGLDLTSCAATGSSDELIYVSPKSGRAVCASAGEAYKSRLLPLPPFLSGKPGSDQKDIAAGFELTGFFLKRHLFDPRARTVPDARERMINLLNARTD